MALGMPRAFKLSPQQQAIIDWGRTGKSSLIVRAYAGCSKTTTGIELCRVLSGLVFFGAFNKSIADEIGNKLAAMGIAKSKVEAATFHSIGYRAWRNFSHIQRGPDSDKCATLLSGLVEGDRKLLRTLKLVKRKNVLSLVSFAKQQAFGVNGSGQEIGDWVKLAQSYGLDEELAGSGSASLPAMVYLDASAAPPAKHQTTADDLVEDLCKLAAMVYRESIATLKEHIDFDDMILAPLLHDVPLPIKDVVIIDEAQDTNPARRMLAVRMLRPGSWRLVAIGDENQGIYRFAGADMDAITVIEREMKAISLPLSVTYRCPQVVVKSVNRFVPDFTAHETAPEGELLTVDYRPRATGGASLQDPGMLPRPGDAVLCRNTRPLVEVLFMLLEKNIPCRLSGSSPAQAYIALIDSMDVDSLVQLRSRLNNYLEAQTREWSDRNPEKLQRVVDKVETILSIASRVERKGGYSVADLTGEITRIFDTDNRFDGGKTNKADSTRVSLMTIHRAKGLEWEKVYILGANLFQPSKYAKKPEDIQQERNLEYVAETRTKHTLVRIMCKKEDFGAGVQVQPTPTLPAPAQVPVQVPTSPAPAIRFIEAEDVEFYD